MKKTPKEIATEIAALKKLKPIGPFAKKTACTIEIQIEALEHGVDDTAPEWEEMGDELQMTTMDAVNWKNGTSPEKPSEGWGALVE